MNWNPRVQRMYQPVGEQMRIQAAGNNRKAYAFGVVDAHNGHPVVRTYDRKRSKEFMSFLEVLREAYPDIFIYIVLDNYAIHKTKEVEEVVELDGRMELVFLPTYSPNLNRMEDIWRTFHSHITKNRLYPSLEAL
ncbi:MAG: IS630 family transposase, partial [Thermoplasmata archaeon]